MNKVKELIKKLHLSNVKYMKIKEVCDGHYGKGNNIPKDGGEYPVYGCNGIVGYTSTFNNIDAPIVGHIGSAGVVTWGKGKHFVTYNGTICTPKKDVINSKYLYYNLEKEHLERYVKGSQPFLSFSDFENLKIPVPPIEVQNEIVKMLDKFTELEAELEIELKARKKQYEYYRKKIIDRISEFKIKNLEECCIILDNKRKPITKSARLKGKYPYYGANGIQDYVSSYIFDGQFILVGEDGTVVDKNGNPIVNWANGKIWVNNHAHIIQESNVDLRYLYYYIQIVNVRELIHGNIPKLNQKDFRNIKIKVPTLEEQKRIVSTLDRFDKLCNDISEGLPAEIEARRKQYEYYRDKLLNFKELKVENKE